MDTARPAQLDGITLTSVEVTAIDLNTVKRPEKNGKGYVQYSLGVRPTFKTKKGEAAPHSFVLNTDAVLKAYAGEPPKDKEPDDGDELMRCQVSLAVRYHIEKPGPSEENLKNLSWHFQPQVSMLAREHLRSLLRDTPFATVPIPVEG